MGEPDQTKKFDEGGVWQCADDVQNVLNVPFIELSNFS